MVPSSKEMSQQPLVVFYGRLVGQRLIEGHWDHIYHVRTIPDDSNRPPIPIVKQLLFHRFCSVMMIHTKTHRYRGLSWSHN